MKLLSEYINQDSLKQYYNASVLPIFDFCCVIWGNTTTANQTRLVKLQKRAFLTDIKSKYFDTVRAAFQTIRLTFFP